jgi:SAM-dependent methyltransferase
MPPRSNANERKSKARAEGPRFDAGYYERFYADPRTRVSDGSAVRKLAGFVAGYLRYLDVPVRSILDVGCGVGHWRTAARRCWPRARYHGLEYSQHLCDRFGWTQGSVVDFDPRSMRAAGTFDLVVCQGVLQYLDDRAAARAITNLGRWCEGALYLEALTQRDWRHNCDRTRTDGDVHLRSGDWYRQRLARHFLDCGGGVFCSRKAGVTLFELEGS